MVQCGPIIFIDDEEEVRLSAKQTFELEGFETVIFERAEPALEYVGTTWPGIIVSDVKMRAMDGIELLERVCRIDPELPVILITGHGDIPLAVAAMRLGAYDFVEKPADPEYLIGVARRALEKRGLVVENRALRVQLDSSGEMRRRILGQSKVIESLRQAIAHLADTDVDVLIVGETGTGKELVARCLHEFGSRREGRFVALNCGALAESVIESELFGHEVGAFTGADRRRIGKIEHAQSGTLFLDEIESMSPSVQVRLLRVLQERTIERLGSNDLIDVDIRVVAASKVDLRAAADKGAFRHDLYYRLHVATLALPRLVERREDIPLLFQQFTEIAARRFGRPAPALDEQKLDEITSRDWPGNVRELRNAAERYVLGLSTSQAQGEMGGLLSSRRETLSQRMESFERMTIATALRDSAGQVGKTAKALGIPRKTLYLRMQKYGLKRQDFI